MLLKELLIKIPYSIAWRLANAGNYSFPVVFFCTDFDDYLVFEPVRKHLPELSIVAKNSTLQNILFEKGISSILRPVYPEVVIMCTDSLHLFPSDNILKIGIQKTLTYFSREFETGGYKRFDLLLLTSQLSLDKANSLGFINCKVSGYVKIDELYSKNNSESDSNKIKSKLNLDRKKETILFYAEKSKIQNSAINLWFNKLELFLKDYNVLVKLHPSIHNKYVERIKNTKNIYYIDNENLNPFLIVSDILICDESSIIAEFCLLNKPIITFESDIDRESNNKILPSLNEISFRVNSFESLVIMLPIAFRNINVHSEKRIIFNSIMSSHFDGNAGKRTAKMILDFLENDGISF